MEMNATFRNQKKNSLRKEGICSTSSLKEELWFCPRVLNDVLLHSWTQSLGTHFLGDLEVLLLEH